MTAKLGSMPGSCSPAGFQGTRKGTGKPEKMPSGLPKLKCPHQGYVLGLPNIIFFSSPPFLLPTPFLLLLILFLRQSLKIHDVAVTVLQLSILPKLALNLWQSDLRKPCLPSVGITGVNHHTWVFYGLFYFCDRHLLYGPCPGRPETHHVARAGLELVVIFLL